MINFFSHKGFFIPETNEKKQFDALEITHLGAKNKIQLQCIVTIGEKDYKTAVLQIPDSSVVLKQVIDELAKIHEKMVIGR